MIYILLRNIKAFLLVTKYGPEAVVQQRKLQKNGLFSSSKKTPRKENINRFNKDIPVFTLNLHQKAESVEVLDKGLTTNIFKIYFLEQRGKTKHWLEQHHVVVSWPSV